MNLKELDSFKISDAITFHDKLNPKLWNGTKLRPEVKQQLEAIADDFLQEMGIHDLDVRDITVSGSNAAYSYTNHSDLDLHILVNISDLPHSEIYKELFHAKKTLYNDTHNITIHKVPIELYVQDASEPVVSLGEYSIKNDEWLKIPTKRRANFDQNATKAKYEKLLDIVKQALASNNLNKIQKVLKKIKQYRQAGLDKGGEFGPENLAFKALRSQGYITKLYDLRDKLHSHRLSIEGMYSNMDEDYDPNGPPPGPEFKPTMPAGTVKVDVSDVYDWYKLGQHISNMKGLGKHDFGSGPPSTILSFGDEDTEHKYIDALQKTGLTTTDIDPVDPNQPKGMKRQKVDPTYNVNEAFDQPYKLKWEKGDYGDVDAYAKLDDGNYLSIMFNKGYNQDKEEAWSVEFFRNNSQEVTGEGDAQRVFATVLSAIQTFIKKYKPNRIIFSASKEVEQGQNAQSRARLYDSLVQRYAKAWGFRAFRADTGDKVIYELNRINKGVAEAINPDILHPKFSHKQEIGDFTYTASVEQAKQPVIGSIPSGVSAIYGDASNPYYIVTWLYIRCFDNNEKIGEAIFVVKGNEENQQWLESYQTKVEKSYQGRNIASTMYAYAKMLGNDIKPSSNQSDQGEAMWSAWEKSGEAEHLTKMSTPVTGVAEAWGLKPVKEDAETTTEHFNGIEISLEVDNDEVMVKAMMSNGREMGHVLFVQEGDYLMPQDLEVEERYQGQGIAATMYDYVKSKGYKIRRSGQQTDAGAGFWDKHRPEQNVWEDDTMQYAAEKTSAINPYGGLKDVQYRGSISEVVDNDFLHSIEAGVDQTVEMNGYSFRVKNSTNLAGRQHRPGIVVTVYDNKHLVAWGDFVLHQDKKDSWLESHDTGVVGKYQNKGIATMMYAIIKSLGFDIKPSKDQSTAGKNMWGKWGKDADHLVSEASGYIPSEKQKNDPRFKTALTVDVKPDSIKKNAKAFAWLTDRAGIPPTAKANGKV